MLPGFVEMLGLLPGHRHAFAAFAAQPDSRASSRGASPLSQRGSPVASPRGARPSSRSVVLTLDRIVSVYCCVIHIECKQGPAASAGVGTASLADRDCIMRSPGISQHYTHSQRFNSYPMAADLAVRQAA